MRVNIYSIQKKSDKGYELIENELITYIKKFAQIKNETIFNNNIAKSQSINSNEAKKSYTQAFKNRLKGFSIALDVNGQELDSFEFLRLFENRNEVSFFIAGAYGFEDDFLKKFDKTISLSKMTFSHKIAKVVLLEQIYRGFAIKNNHPYHK